MQKKSHSWRGEGGGRSSLVGCAHFQGEQEKENEEYDDLQGQQRAPHKIP